MVAPTFDTGGKKAKLLFVDDEERILNALHRYSVVNTTYSPPAAGPKPWSS